MKRIVLTGGGTGGHLYPLTTVAEYLRKNSKENFEFLFVGPKGELEKRVMDEHNIIQKNILCGKWRRYFSLLNFIDLFKFPLGFFQALWKLLWFMPDVVFAKGGYASVPVVMAARIYRVPVLIHESDAKPGAANKFLGSLASRVAINFKRAQFDFPPAKVVRTGIPVRPEIMGGSAEEARKILSMRKEVKPVILIIGGSQGARVINDQVIFALKDLIKKYQVIHQTGEAHYDYCVRMAQKKGFKIEHSDYYPVAFYGDEVKHYFDLADVVVSRAGATSISELAANKKASILVPIIKSANNHQRLNAYEVSKAGGAVVLEEGNLRKNLLLFNLKTLSTDKELRQRMGEAIGKFYYPDATQRITLELLELMK